MERGASGFEPERQRCDRDGLRQAPKDADEGNALDLDVLVVVERGSGRGPQPGRGVHVDELGGIGRNSPERAQVLPLVGAERTLLRELPRGGLDGGLAGLELPGGELECDAAGSGTGLADTDELVALDRHDHDGIRVLDERDGHAS
jgi:hypothetical protein